ncbi:MAG: PDZ domain-containing protein [Alicyclobacillus sp.]|nr:PDZ domain-containing protein [Alicyclobacillus sp.]
MSDNLWWTTAYELRHSLLWLVRNPLLYVGAALVVWDLGRGAKAERRTFGVRLTRPWRGAVSRWAAGVGAGVLVSAAFLAVGVTVLPWEVFAVSGLSLALAALRLRFMAPAYGVTVCTLAAGLLSLLARWQPAPQGSGWLSAAEAMAAEFHTVDWATVVGGVTLAEVLLLVLGRSWAPSPAALLSKRGRAIGAFVVRLSFILPFLTLTPGTATLPVTPAPPWPWLGPQGGVAFLACPAVAGFHGVFAGQRPKKAVSSAIRWTLTAGLAALAGAVISHWFGAAWAVLGLAASVALREGCVWQARRAENRLEPLYVDTPDGVRILAVARGSVAEQMGLLPGEIITHVNQIPVHSAYDLHFAFDQSPAYAKLQVLDARGEARIMGKPVYAGGRNQLGLILSPDGRRSSLYLNPQHGLFQTLYLRFGAAGERDAGPPAAEPQAAPPAGS